MKNLLKLIASELFVDFINIMLVVSFLLVMLYSLAFITVSDFTNNHIHSQYM